MTRRVVLVCGPPGAGKTTYANELGLEVYDIDEPQWNNDERLFRQALANLARNPNAQAVVIRSGATGSARTKAALLVGATEVKIIATDRKTCVERVVSRNRPRPSIKMQIAAVSAWWDKYEDDGPTIGVTSRDW